MSQLPARPVRQVDRLQWMPGEIVVSPEDIGESVRLLVAKHPHLRAASILNHIKAAKSSAEELITNAIYKAHKESQET